MRFAERGSTSNRAGNARDRLWGTVGSGVGHCSTAGGLVSAVLVWARSTAFRDMKKIKAGVRMKTRNAREVRNSTAPFGIPKVREAVPGEWSAVRLRDI